MSFDPLEILIGFVFSAIGLIIFRKGRQRTRTPWIMSGILLMIYPYFTTGALYSFLVGAVLCGYAYYTRWD